MSENGYAGVVEEALKLGSASMLARLRTDPESIPAHALSSFLMTMSKLRDREASEESAAAPVAPLAALDSLPPERQADLLRSEIERLETTLAAYRLRLSGLEEPDAVQAR